MNEKFIRLENETDKQYQTRLSQYKLLEGEDLDWEDIKELLESTKHRDTLRREGYGIEIATEVYEEKINKIYEEHYQELRKMKEKVNEEIEDKRLKEIDNKVLQLKVEKQKLKDERNFVNAQVRTIARVEHLIECLGDKIEELNTARPLVTEEVIIRESDTDAIMLLSDIHIGVECDNILDKYNPEICRQKLNYYIDKCITRINKEEPEVIHFLCAGDLISGIIHTTTRFTNRLDVSEQVAYASELISEAIAKVRKECKIPVKVGILSGNHDRIVADKDQHIEEENFTKFIADFVKMRLRADEGIEFYKQDDVTRMNLNIRGQKCVMVHGNLDKKRNIDRLIEMEGDSYDYIFQGHWHKFSTEPHNHTQIITNGCFGGEQYARNARLYNKPIQLLMFFNDDGLESMHPINLDGYKK